MERKARDLQPGLPLGKDSLIWGRRWGNGDGEGWRDGEMMRADVRECVCGSRCE